MQIVKAYQDYFSANIDKHILETEGIQCMLLDEHTISMNWLYANGLGGIKLVVADSDYLKAIDIIKEKDAAAEEQGQNEVKPLDEEEEMLYSSDNKVCPHCGSRNTRHIGYEKLPAFVSLLLWGFPIMFRSDQWHCYHCNNKFVVKREK